MKKTNSAIFLIAVFIISISAAFAQETQLTVVDEVVAQVNEDVITRSSINREINEAIETLMQEGKTLEEAKALIESKKGELIAGIINEQLIIQKGKELGVEADVEAEINNRFRLKLQELELKSLDKLYEMMRSQNIDPDDIREMWRKQIIRDMVLQREVDYKIYWGWGSKEIKDYYEKNKARFTKPETLEISEIFLSFAGLDRASVIEKAKQIVAKARSGEDFAVLAVANSERQDVQTTKGKVGKVKVKELDPKFADPLKDVKAGGISDPIILDEGVEILRVDERTAATTDSVFDEVEVRQAMTVEKIPEERKKFLTRLREDAYIKINDSYRPLVSPVLYADERSATAEKKPGK